MPAGIYRPRRRPHRRGRFQVRRQLRPFTHRLPVRRAFGLREGLGVHAILGHPNPQLLHTGRAVGLSILADDFIHAVLLYQPGNLAKCKNCLLL